MEVSVGMSALVKNWKIGATLVAVTVAILSGCTTQDVPPPPSPSTSAATTTTTTTTSTPPLPFRPYIYEADPEREARISAVTRQFGLLVLQESRKGDSRWGVFDTFCAPKGQTDGKWTSRGHVPQVGEVCGVQHTPAYRGPAIHVAATYELLPGNQYHFVGVTANVSPDCSVEARHVSYGSEKKVSTTKFIMVGTEMKSESSSNATTAAEARAIDEKVIACIQNTRP